MEKVRKHGGYNEHDVSASCNSVRMLSERKTGTKLSCHHRQHGVFELAADRCQISSAKCTSDRNLVLFRTFAARIKVTAAVIGLEMTPVTHAIGTIVIMT